jgi:hypothetical protein
LFLPSPSSSTAPPASIIVVVIVSVAYLASIIVVVIVSVAYLASIIVVVIVIIAMRWRWYEASDIRFVSRSVRHGNHCVATSDLEVLDVVPTHPVHESDTRFARPLRDLDGLAVVQRDSAERDRELARTDITC